MVFRSVSAIALALIFISSCSIVTTDTPAPASTLQPISPPRGTLNPGYISMERLRRHVSFLAADKLGGQRPGTPGYDLAVEYAAQILDNAGLMPGWHGKNDGLTFLQSVPLYRYSIGPDNYIRYKSSTASGTIFYQDNLYTFYYPGMGHKILGNGQVLYLGYGIHEPAYGWDDYGDLDIPGSLVIIENGVPEGLPNFNLPPELTPAYASGAKSKVLPLIEKGAAAIAMIMPPDMSWDRVFGRLRFLNYFPIGYADPTVPPIFFLHPMLVENLFSGQPYDPLEAEGVYHTFY